MLQELDTRLKYLTKSCKFFSSATTVAKLCNLVDGMKSPLYIPKQNIKISSTKKGRKPTDVRPGGQVWTSKKTDRKPRIVITLGKKPVPTKSVQVVKTQNVRFVRVIFVVKKGKSIAKVSTEISII